jgi:hypothetical protein
MMEGSTSNQTRRSGDLAALHKSALRKLFSGRGVGGFAGPTSSQNTPSAIAGKKRARTDNNEDPSCDGTSASDSRIASLRQELDSLRKRKALLAGEVEQLRSGCVGLSEDIGPSPHGNNTTCTVADELVHVRARACASQKSTEGIKSSSKRNVGDEKWSNRQYLHKYDDRDGVGLIVGRKRSRHDVSASPAAIAGTHTCSAIGDGANDEIDRAISEAIDASRREVRARTLAEHMHKIRTQRRIAAAHRLAGISALPLGSRIDDENVLGVRIDVCTDGSFVARYHVFFDIVMIPDDEQDNYFGGDDVSNGNARNQSFRTVLRLAQHTLPTPGVSSQPILRKHFGPDSMLPIDEDGDASQNKEAIINIVRRCIGDLSDACHSFIKRRDACRYLQGKQTLNKQLHQPQSPSRYFQNLAHNDSFDRISFDFHYEDGRSGNGTTGEKNERAGLTVQLMYDNQMTARPTSMRIKAIQLLTEKNMASKDEMGSSIENDGRGSGDDDVKICAATLINELKEALLSDPLPFVFEQNFDALLSKCMTP